MLCRLWGLWLPWATGPINVQQSEHGVFALFCSTDFKWYLHKIHMSCRRWVTVEWNSSLNNYCGKIYTSIQCIYAWIYIYTYIYIALKYDVNKWIYARSHWHCRKSLTNMTLCLFIAILGKGPDVASISHTKRRFISSSPWQIRLYFITFLHFDNWTSILHLLIRIKQEVIDMHIQ